MFSMLFANSLIGIVFSENGGKQVPNGFWEALPELLNYPS